MKTFLALRGLWPVYLFLLASLGPLVVFWGNLNRIMIETVIGGILALVLTLVSLRVVLAVVFRRPSITDPLIALLVLGGFYNSFFSSDRNDLIFWIWLAICLLPIPFLFVSRRLRRVLPKALCIFLGLLNVIVIASILQNDVWDGRSELRSALDTHYPPLPVGGPAEASVRPDIYFIVFDRYARADQLARVYDFDNRGFLNALRERDFQVSERAYGAYQRTAHSLASTLNLDYLPIVDGPASDDWVPLYENLRAPRLYDFLHGEGYSIVNMGSWWEPTRTSSAADDNISYFAVPESLRPMVEGSAALRGLSVLSPGWFDPRNRQCARIKHKFDALTRVGSPSQPTFVFAHFLVPHPPFVIDADGTCKTAEQAREASRRDNYIAQLEYTNSAILNLIDTLMARVPRPVIILQSDEGPWPEQYAGDEISRFGGDVTSVDWNNVASADLREKMAILNAIYLPGKSDSLIPDDFSPVNTFRVILREYFGVPLEDLESTNWVFLSDASLWQFRDVRSQLTEQDPQ